MAKIKFQAGISEIYGSVSGTSFYRSRHGNLFKTKGLQKRGETDQQTKIENISASVSSSWKKWSEEEREEFKNKSSIIPDYTSLLFSRSWSSFQAYQKLNFYRVFVNDPISIALNPVIRLGNVSFKFVRAYTSGRIPFITFDLSRSVPSNFLMFIFFDYKFGIPSMPPTNLNDFLPFSSKRLLGLKNKQVKDIGSSGSFTFQMSDDLLQYTPFDYLKCTLFAYDKLGNFPYSFSNFIILRSAWSA